MLGALDSSGNMADNPVTDGEQVLVVPAPAVVCCSGGQYPEDELAPD